jgi:regulator of protease activity HflC (stomatin/prohibitin superfamily)
MGVEMPMSPMAEQSAPHLGRDPYRGVVLVLLTMALLGAVGAFAGSLMLPNPLVLDAAVTLALSTGMLVGIAVAQAARAKPQHDDEASIKTPAQPSSRSADVDSTKIARPTDIRVRLTRWYRDHRGMRRTRMWTAAMGVLAISATLPLNPVTGTPALLLSVIATALCLCAAGLAFTAAHYLADIDPALFPEGPGLCRGTRVVGWILIAAAVSIGLGLAGQQTAIRILHCAVVFVNAAVCYGLLAVTRPEDKGAATFPLDIGVLALLGSRTNIVASVLDAAERQLGIDLRSTWALTVVRRSVEPLAIGLCLLGWLSTSVTVVRVDEQGLVERLGVPVGGQPLMPGLHVHWPWPVDRVFRIPVQHVQALTVGHEGQEEGRPENVLWAREHAVNEYTLLLGNGRDLITVDAAVQFRIADARAWHYHSQNPADALRAIAYRAVMRSTVNRTLAEALSENLITLTARMRTMVQQDAEALGLGVDVVAFTVGGMHPPVMVASDYQAVVSAELGKVTATVNAQVFRNQTVPAAEAAVVMGENAARAEGAAALARAAGGASSFRTLESQYLAAPEEYRFRRRLETLENGLAGRHFTVVDTRIQRDGGELWLLP